MLDKNPQQPVSCLADNERKMLEEVIIAYLLARPVVIDEVRRITVRDRTLRDVLHAVKSVADRQDEEYTVAAVIALLADRYAHPIGEAEKFVGGLGMLVPSKVMYKNALVKLRTDDKRRATNRFYAQLVERMLKIDASQSEEETTGNLEAMINSVPAALAALLPEKNQVAAKAFEGGFSSLWEEEVNSPAPTSSTHYPKLDSLSGGGYYCGENTVLAGPSGSGKTAFALNLAIKKALEDDAGVLYVSLEVKAQMMRHRIYSMLSGVDCTKFKTQSLTPEDIEEVNAAFDPVRANLQKNLKIFDSPDMCPADIRSAAMEYIMNEEQKIGLIVVDYIGIMRPDNPSGDSGKRYLEQEETVKTLKEIGALVGAPVLLLAQLTKESERLYENNPDRLPRKEDLGESKILIHHSEQIWILKPSERYPAEITLHSVKNRTGAKDWAVPFRFASKELRFTEI